MLLLGVLVLQFFRIMIIKHDLYEQKAIAQQTRDIVIEARRGSITDRNGNILAVSATAYKVVMAPAVIKADETREEIAKNLSEILDMDYDSVYAMTKKNLQYVEVKRRIEKDVADRVTAFIRSDKKYSEVLTVTEDTKRYYPNGNMLSTVLGFVGADSQGLAGIESMYDSYLKGSNGKLIAVKTSLGTSMPFEYEKMIEPSDGSTVVLTVDMEIQAILEKYIANARVEYNVQEGVWAAVMDVKTGEILGMTSKPDYDPNTPFEITDEITLRNLASIRDRDEYVKQYNSMLGLLRKNRVVSENYFLGSTFKIFTGCMALEEGLVSLNETFNCCGSLVVSGITVHCHKRTGHGTETFKDALANSCNPVFMTLGARIGQYKMYDYITLFGLRTKTGVGLPGEENGVNKAYGTMTDLDLAEASFGQLSGHTAMQLIAGVSSVANGGKYMQPYIVKEIVDNNGNVVLSNEPTVLRKTISEETAIIMREYLENAVVKGKTGYLAGYRIAGKTGTSQKLNSQIGDTTYVKKIASFVCFAPVDDPQVCVLVVVDEPVSDIQYGSYIAAPLGRDIMGETLQILGVEPDYGNGQTQKNVRVPRVVKQDVEKATSDLAKKNLHATVVGNGTSVVYQLPAKNEEVPEGSEVLLFTEENYQESMKTTVPNVVGKTAAECNLALVNCGLNIRIEGGGTGLNYSNMVAVSQSVQAGTEVNKMTVITVTFAER